MSRVNSSTSSLRGAAPSMRVMSALKSAASFFEIKSAVVIFCGSALNRSCDRVSHLRSRRAATEVRSQRFRLGYHFVHGAVDETGCFQRLSARTFSSQPLEQHL